MSMKEMHRLNDNHNSSQNVILINNETITISHSRKREPTASVNSNQTKRHYSGVFKINQMNTEKP